MATVKGNTTPSKNLVGTTVSLPKSEQGSSYVAPNTSSNSPKSSSVGGAITASGDIIGAGGAKVGTASSKDSVTRSSPVVVTPAAATQDFNKITAENTAIQSGIREQAANNSNSQPTFSTGDVQKFLEGYKKNQEAANANQASTQGTSAADILKNYMDYQQSGGDTSKVPDTVFNGAGTSSKNTQVGGAVDRNGNIVRSGQTPVPQTFEDQVNSALNENKSEYDNFLDQMDSLKRGTFPLSATEQALVDSTNQSFERQKQAQELANKNLTAGVTQFQAITGLDRYAPMIAMGKIAEAVNYGIGKITDIESQRVKAVAELQQGFEEKNYKMITDSYNAYKEYSKEKLDTLENMHDQIITAERDVRDYGLRLAEFELKKREADRKADDEVKKMNLVTPPLINHTTGKIDPSNQLTTVIANSGAKSDDKLKLTNAVVAAIQTLAENNPEGEFEGFGPLGSLKSSTFVTPEGQSNRTFLSALEGTVESWMTGASVATDQQKRIKEDLVPQRGDTDGTIKRKLNSLTDYMLNYAKGNLSAQGVSYNPSSVDYFKSIKSMSNEDLLNSVPTASKSNEEFLGALVIPGSY